MKMFVGRTLHLVILDDCKDIEEMPCPRFSQCGMII